MPMSLPVCLAAIPTCTLGPTTSAPGQVPVESFRGGRAMGRGRAKAKQTKVARDLKYNSAPDWDPNRLASELRGNGHATKANEDDDNVDPYEYDPYDDESDDSP